MKQFILPVLFLWINILPAQDYQNICSPGITFYKDHEQNFKAFRQDSIRITGGSDTTFYSFRTIRDSSIYFGICRDTTNGGALGRKIFRKHDGWFLFFNRKNDTIRVNSLAALNESWKYCSLPGNGYLQATVTGIITDSVLGTTDQVKVISFQAKDVSNNNIASIFNQKTIKLSQHFGLSEIYDIYWTPSDTIRLTLIGKTTPPLGLQPYTWSDVYSFDVGDEFHYYGYHLFNGGMSIYWKSISTILGKTVYGNPDSVHYLVDECRKTWYPYPTPNAISTHDTVIQAYDFNQLSSDRTISMLPDEFVHTGEAGSPGWRIPLAACTYSAFNHRPVQIFNNVAYEWSIWDSCYSNPFESWGPISCYVPGLGLTSWDDWEFDITVTEYHNSLVYFRKGSEIWGTPVATDCSVLTGSEIREFSNQPDITVIPNPAETEARVFLHGFNPGENLFYSLYNYSGLKVYEGKSISNPFILHRNGRASGLYVLVISDMKGKIQGKTKIIFR